MTAAYRAPMRSRRQDVDPQDAIDRARSLGLCGFGGDHDPPPAVGDDGVRLWVHSTDIG